MSIFLSKVRVIIFMIIILAIVVFFIVFINVRNTNKMVTLDDSYKFLLDFFDISINEYSDDINVLSITLEDDNNEDGDLFLNISVTTNMVNTIFKNYLHLDKHEDITYVPHSAREQIPAEFTFEYYYYFIGSVERKNILTKEVSSQDYFIVFFKEQEGKVPVLLYCNKANWSKYEK